MKQKEVLKIALLYTSYVPIYLLSMSYLHNYSNTSYVLIYPSFIVLTPKTYSFKHISCKYLSSIVIITNIIN